MSGTKSETDSSTELRNEDNERIPELSAEHIPALEDGTPKTLVESTVFREYLKRLKQGRDLKLIIDAQGNETGVGKTLLGTQLAMMMDIHGFDAERQATMDAREYMDLYSSMPRGSAAYLQESEKSGDKRRSMSNEVMNLGYTFAILRKRQIFPILDLPDATNLDDRIIKQCDFRILVRDRGHAIVFSINTNDFSGEKIWSKTEDLHWDNMPECENYEILDEMKDAWISGEMESKYVPREEFEEAKKNFYEKFKKKWRYHMARGVWELLQERGLTGKGGNISQADMAAALGRDHDELEISQTAFSQIVNSESFDSFYNE